jgi:chromosome segregation protein
MVGFKSFAERTVVEFGSGISAVVGPNGSGKSNLADALRWALGEQGRALRSRRAEDLIFAGSANRRAVGMADVSLLVDNSDRLLSLDYGEVELSRRLYRSGENEYLLNRQRIRLRDLVDLLDDANLADNAFLFIGQGMVDQALALRPEERRPLFEEAAGIRKHQRRRARAEGELTEAAANLERVRDLLAELRPQARRLAAQAEQQEARTAAGAELASALVEVARTRLREVEAASRRHAETLASSRQAADAALAALRDAEESATRLTRALADRAETEQRERAELDAVRGEVQQVELAQARALSDGEALRRDRARVAAERAAATARAEEARQVMAGVLPEPDSTAEAALETAERRLAEVSADAEQLRQAGRADQERAALVRATRTRLAGDLERAARRAADSEHRLRAQEDLAASTRVAAAEATTRAAAADRARQEAHTIEESAEREAADARQAAAQADAALATAREAAARLRAESEGLAAREHALRLQEQEGVEARVLRSLPARRGRRFTDGLEVEPELRGAVEAALGEALAGLVLDVADARGLAEASAVLVLREPAEGRARGPERPAARLEEAVLAAGGGWLTNALRLDPEGHAARLLGRCAWVPDLDAALAIRGQLPPGWRLVTRSGVVVDDLGVVRPAPGASILERRAMLVDVARRSTQASEQLAVAQAAAEEAAAARATVETRLSRAREALESARRARRLADEQERSAAGTAENAGRELAWQEALLERAGAEAAAAAEEARLRTDELAGHDEAGAGELAGQGDRAALAAVEARLAVLREEREVVARRAAEARAARERALEERRRAEVGLGLARARLRELDDDDLALSAREADLAAEQERRATVLAATQGRLQAATEAFEASVAAARADRQALLAAESTAGAARERLRQAEQRSRAGEVAEMEARLQLDAAREGLLVELAAIGPDALTALLAEDGQALPEAELRSEELPDLLEAALESALERWQAEAAGPALDGVPEPPTRGRIASLRRRFNEVGAGNPFAAQELAEVSARLESLDAQRDDLEQAIRDTREMMGRLDELMSVQFRETFQALEGAFARRFQQLFGGGEAQLSLTEPSDLTITGVEIMARPPGKRRQPLAMLSGGERALTAVSLLLAMLEVRPVPFCVLDEVDAALDEANIGRFSAALRSLAQEIQFVVITHNRGTIEAADALYGVTVGDDAVSRVVSLRLADLPEPGAAALAGRA